MYEEALLALSNFGCHYHTLIQKLSGRKSTAFHKSLHFPSNLQSDQMEDQAIMQRFEKLVKFEISLMSPLDFDSDSDSGVTKRFVEISF